ncbi:MAG: sigma-70 family RNA polymerase sigma factor [Acidobacteriota bacterium]|nr:sigma-70 family RNA polymerase sigma factor [Acidobacteriota bacterium]
MQMAIPSFDRLMFEENLLRRLIREAKAGDASSFERLVLMHQRLVLRLAQRLLLNREAAKDAAQDVFLRLHKKIGSVDEDRDLGRWLYRTTANICFDVLRRAKHDLTVDLVADVPDGCRDPEQLAAAIQERQLILAALKDLSPRERQAIVLRDLEGYSSAEVAQILGSTETTVRSQISTGRAKMKNFIVAAIRRRI